MTEIETQTTYKAPKNEVFQYLTNPYHIPQWFNSFVEVEIIQAEKTLKKGDECSLIGHRYGFYQHCQYQVTDYTKDQLFSYRQKKGLFTKWLHSQRFIEENSQTTIVVDKISYQMPFGLLGCLLNDLLIRNDIEKILKNRVNIAQNYLMRFPAPTPPVMAPTSL